MDFETQVEKQGLISNINTMRTIIGVEPITFNFLWKKDVQWLRDEQESTIAHYNNAVNNSKQTF